jgi:uncharacterized protein (DUF2062 family)
VRHAPGWGLGAMGLPTAVVAGIPFRSGAATVLVAVVTSIALWMALGAWAARRALRSPIASWREWTHEFAWLAVPVWVGSLVGAVVLGAVALLL